jgi:hypothetical protein
MAHNRQHPPRTARAMGAPKRQVLSVAQLGCAYLLNPCNQTLLRPLPGSTFELVRGAHDPGSSMPLPRFARLHGLAPKTLHNRICRGELGPEDGLEKRRGHWWVVDPVRFEQAIAGTK